jgi:diguanylate cyclase (GGDEF)-like protein
MMLCPPILEELTMGSGFRKGPFSLRLLLTLPVLLQVSCAVGLVGVISFRNGQKAVDDLVITLQQELVERVDSHLNQFFSLPQQLNQLNGEAIQANHLSPDRLDLAGRYFCRQAQIFPQLSYIGFNWNDGRGAGSGRWLKNAGLLISEDRDRQSRSYQTSADCQRSRLKETLNYAPLTDAWYQTSQRLGKTNWGPIDVADGYDNYVAISANKPVYDRKNQLIGVLNIDLLLPNMSDFLQSIRPSPGSLLFIVERNGDLVATSESLSLYPRVKALQASTPLLQTMSRQLINGVGGFDRLNKPITMQLNHNNNHYFLHAMPWSDSYGLDFVLVSVLPESDFLGAINDNIKQTALLSIVAILCTILMGLITARRLVEPIERVIGAISELASGNWQKDLKGSHIKELGQLTDGFNQMASQMRLSFTTLEYNAHHDSLTGLLNQGAFREQLQRSIDRRVSSNQQFAVMFLDLDHFKYVNDSFGHLIGDMLLVEVSQRLQDCLRSSDIIARFGGDEFVILLDKIESIEDALQVADRIQKNLKKSFLLDDKEVFVSTSVGIVLGQNADADRLLANADWALYAAKSKGKATHVIFGEHLHIESMERIQLETELRHAIERSEFEVYYQPIVDLRSRVIYGFEALIRWHHPERGFVSPDSFIPIAEETGLIVPMDWWVIEQACQQLYDWQRRFDRSDLTMSVNLSQKQFSQPDFVDSLTWVLRSVGLDPETLKLEITERIIMDNDASAKLRAQELREMGVQLSIDDFGTGYSSLSRIQELPINTLKVDRSFISHLNNDQDSTAIVDAIVAMASSLDLTVIVEGIETDYQCDRLRDMGCNQGQGYLFSRPVGVVQATALLEESMDADLRVIEEFIRTLALT